MRRVLILLLCAAICFTAAAQMETSIVVDGGSLRAVQTDALTGVNIDPIGQDRSRRPCARLKIFFHRMTREQMAQLEPVFPSGTIDYTKCKVADGNTVLILEFTARPQVQFYLKHPTFGTSNEVTFDYEGNKEYQIEASLNQTFSIVVNSNVAGADVYLNGEYKGKTDDNFSCTVSDVMIGGHTLKLTYGSVSHEQSIEVNKSSISFRQNVDTAASQPQFVVFAVEPQSAVVTIEGKHYSLTDGAMRLVLESGTYNYTVSAAGYHSQSGTFTVAGSKVTKQITLTADVATVTLTVADNAEIWVNGEKVGNSRWSGKLNSGTYIFEAKKAGHSTTTTSKHITSDNPQQNYTLESPKPLFGSLIVDGSPLMADVIVDGKAVGQMPLKLGDILVGEHTVVVSKLGYETYTQSVTIADGKTITVNVALKKQITSTLKGVTPIEIDSSLTAEQLEAKGGEHFGKKEYNSAVQYFFKAAQLGRAVSQRSLGYCYSNGLGVTQDYYEAVKWYRKAAEQGDDVAQNNLGVCYENGRGVTQDYYEAVKWYRKAVEQGLASAQNNLGVCYELGRGVTKDYTEAVKWYRKAAEQGLAGAQDNLGNFYSKGNGVTQDYAEAVKWYRKAAEQGDAVAQNNMGNYYNERQNYMEAARWYRKAAEQGQIAAQSSLAELYYNGRGVAKDYAEAVKWYRKAAEQGAPGAQYQLGNCYYFGYGVTQSYAEAVRWYRKAAEVGLADAQSDLGYCYRMGQGVVRDDAEGVKWYRKAAEQGCVQAQINLADCYRAGNGVTKSIPEAVKWYRKAASRGSDEAKSKLAELGY